MISFSTFLPVVGFLIGMVLAFLVSSKYEFRIEFDHADDTGVQWFTAAKSRKIEDLKLFQKQADILG